MYSSVMIVSLLAMAVPVLSQTQTKPNILFVFIDDLGWNDVSYHGSSDYQTPKMDQLATVDGIQLDQFYTQSSCSPARAALLTGRYPMRMGLHTTVIAPQAAYGLPLEEALIPNELQRANYSTHMIGKWNMGHFNPAYVPTARGFDSFFGFYLPSEDHFNHTKDVSIYSGYDLREDDIPIMRAGEYSTTMYGDRAMEIIQAYEAEADPKPFFIYLSIAGPHEPLEAPESYITALNGNGLTTNRQIFAAMVRVVDEKIGELADHMKLTGTWSNTLMFVVSDNGGASGSNLAASSNWPLRGAKTNLLEGGVRSVAFVTGGVIPAELRGNRNSALMHITDILPTLCSYAGISPTASDLDGVDQRMNLEVFVRNPYSPRSDMLLNIISRNDVCTASLGVCGAVRWLDFKLISMEASSPRNGCLLGWCTLADSAAREDPNKSTVQCVKDGVTGNLNFPAVDVNNECPYNGSPCMYDLSVDPCEYNNLINNSNYTAEKQMLVSLLKQFGGEQATPLNEIYGSNAAAADPALFGGFWSPYDNADGFPVYQP